MLLLLFNFGYAHLTTTTAATMEIITTTKRSLAAGEKRFSDDRSIDRLDRLDRLDRMDRFELGSLRLIGRRQPERLPLKLEQRRLAALSAKLAAGSRQQYSERIPGTQLF